MSPSKPLPAVLGAVPALPDPDQSCRCFCGARHGVGVCAGTLEAGGWRVQLNSLYCPPEGVPVCRPCAEAWPELTLHAGR